MSKVGTDEPMDKLGGSPTESVKVQLGNNNISIAFDHGEIVVNQNDGIFGFNASLAPVSGPLVLKRSLITLAGTVADSNAIFSMAVNRAAGEHIIGVISWTRGTDPVSITCNGSLWGPYNWSSTGTPFDINPAGHTYAHTG